jgi:hypothetical protein
VSASSALAVGRQTIDAAVAEAGQTLAERGSGVLVGDLDDEAHTVTAALGASLHLVVPPRQTFNEPG